MPNEKIIGRVTIKVIPEVDNHRPEMERDIDRQLDKVEKRSRKRKPIKVEVELDTDGLEDDLDEAIDGAEKEAKKRTLNLKMAFDYDDVLRGTEQIRAAIKDLARDKNKISIELNEEALLNKLDDLTGRLSSTPVHMRVSDDIQGARQVLKKIEEIRAEAAKIEFKPFKTDPKSLDKLEADLKKKFKELSTKATAPKLKFQSELDRESLKKTLAQIEKAKQDLVTPPMLIEVDADTAGLNKAEREVRSRLAKTPIRLRYDPNDSASILRAVTELKKEITEKPVGLPINIEKPNQGAVKAVVAKLERELGVIKSTIQVDYDDQDSLKAAKKRIEDDLKAVRANKVPLNIGVDEKSLLEAKHKVESFIKSESGKDIKLPVNPTGIGLTSARLANLARPRIVDIIVKVNAKSVAVAAGILKSLAGAGALQRIGNTLENVITNFDKFAVKSTGWMTAIGSVTNVLGYMLTSLFSIGGGVSQIIGLAALLPALGASTAAVFTVLTMGFNNFSQSFSDIPIIAEQALAKLPPAARKARDSMVGLWAAVRDPVQNRFWEELGTSVQDFAHRVMPEVGRGLLAITPAVARFTKRTLDSFEEIARNGQMKEMFRNLGTGFDNLSRGAKPFFDALNTLGLRGSQFLPRMGDALADMAEDFDEWITRADEAGDITRWIEEGIDAMQDMGGVVHAVARQFAALTQIIDAGGGQGLDGFRRNMEAWADVMEREPFRSNMTRILRGAREGASELNVGFKELFTTIGDSSRNVETLLTLLGKVGSGALERISDIIGRPVMQSGLLAGVEKVERAIDRIEPAAQDIGDILGEMFDVSGDVLLGIAPMINTVADILSVIVKDMAPTLSDLVPILSGFLNSILSLTQGPLQVMSDTLGLVVGAVKDLPVPMQNLVLAFASFLALRSRIGSMSKALDTFWNGQKTVMKNGVALTTTNATRFRTALDKYPAAITGARGKIDGANKGFAKSLDGMPVAISGTTDKVKSATGGLRTAGAGVATAVKGIGTALSGVLAFGGGLGGILLFTGIIAGITALGQASAKERENIDNLKTSLSTLGDTTSRTREEVAKWMTDTSIKSLGKDSNLVEIFDAMGIGAETAARKITGTKQDFDQLMTTLSRRQNEITRQILEENAKLGKLGESPDQKRIQALQAEGDQINSVISNIAQKRSEIEKAIQQVMDTAAATGTSASNVKTLEGAMDTLGDSMATAAEKGDALNQALDVLSGGVQSQQEAAIALADSIRGIRDAVKAAKEGKVKISELIDSSGKINVSIDADPSGLKAKLAQSLTEGTRQALQSAFAEADTAPPADRLAVFSQAYEKALAGIRAEVEPFLKGDAGQKKQQFDSWLKANGWDKATVEALIDGKVDAAELAKLPPEIQSFIQSWLDSNPAKVPIDGDTLPLQGTVTAANLLLQNLGAVRADPKIGADKKPLDDVSASALEVLRLIDGSTAEADISANAAKLNEAQKLALQKLTGINNYEAIPTIDANGDPLSVEVRDSLAKLLGLQKTKTEPKLDANGKPLANETQGAKKNLESVDNYRVETRLDANGNPLREETRAANARLNEVDNNNANPWLTISTFGLGAVYDAAAILGSLNGNYYRSTYEINTRYTTSGTPRISEGRGGRGGLTQADGGIVGYPGSQYRPKPSAHRFFADGGFTKPSSAHIAPNGSYVTYAESGTGGEAFIPLSASKRARSAGILGEVARMFGMQLVKGGKSFEDGGINAGGGSGATYNITNHYPQAEPTSSAINRAAQVTTVRDRD